MRRRGLKNWKEIVWYGWVVGGALIAVNASIAYLLGIENIHELWGV
jgi:hypothetical protein